MSSIILNLPSPITLNHYWGQRGKIRFLTQRAKDFRESVRKAVESQPVRFGAARLSIAITVSFPDRRKRDIDNITKSTLDALMHAGLFDDDEQIDLLTVRRGKVVKGGSCAVEVRTLCDSNANA